VRRAWRADLVLRAHSNTLESAGVVRGCWAAPADDVRDEGTRPLQFPSDQAAEDAAGLSGSRAGQGGVASSLSKLSASDRDQLLRFSKSGAQYDEVRAGEGSRMEWPTGEQLHMGRQGVDTERSFTAISRCRCAAWRPSSSRASRLTRLAA
jgi:hypothetical protein